MRPASKKLIEAFKARGLGGAAFEFGAYRRRARERRNYQKWLRTHGHLNDVKRAEFREIIDGFDRLPLVSIVLPVYNVGEKWLRLCIGSVQKQVYGNWELCIADDCSTATHVRAVLEEYAASDERIKVIFRKENGHISAASNTALELATGEFTVLLDHDDELSEDALFWVANEIVNHPGADMIYSDEDVIDERGRRYDPKFKPDFARDLFYSLNLVTHLSAYRTELLQRIGGFRIGMEGSQDYDLALRVIEQIPEENIRHIPLILYHWRAIGTSVAYSGEAKPYAYAKAREALHEHFVRTDVEAKVIPATHNLNRVLYTLPKEPPSVSVIFLAENPELGAATANELAAQTSYQKYKLVMILPEETRGAFGPLVLPSGVEATMVGCSFYGLPAKLNFAVSQTEGEILCFVDARLRPVGGDWLSEMVSFAIQEKIGAVGAKIVDAAGNIRHVAMVLGQHGSVQATNAGADVFDAGYFFRAGLTGNFSAVSAACMAVRRDVFESVKGFDEAGFTKKFFDADLCLRLREHGLRTVYTPYAEMMEHESVDLSDLGTPDDFENFIDRWKAYIERDPFYNPNLSKTKLFSIDV